MRPAPPESPRLRLRELTPDDAGHLLAVLNDPDFIAHVADRGVRTLEQARAYLEAGPLAAYRQHGYGLWAVESKPGGEFAGICGLVTRDSLPAPDVGYALLPAWRGQGLAREAARLSLAFGLRTLGLPRVLAIVSEDHAASRRLLESLGMQLQGPRDFEGETLLVYAIGPDA